MEGQIRLRWTSHQGTILSVFDALLSSESLVDVTLACEGHYLRAHKVILSACSPYFQELLNLDPNKHPIFFLKDVKYAELKALIQYMYRGEVNIAQEDLASLLEVAQALKIRGLAEVETTNNSISSDTIILPDLPTKGTGLSKATPAAPPPAVVSVASTSTHATRSLSQTHSFPAATALATDVGANGSSSVPPPNKRCRIETRLSKKNVKVPNQTASVDPLSSVSPQPTVTLKRFDQLIPNAGSSSYDSIGQTEETDFGPEETIEQPEAYVNETLKIEAVTGGIDIDLANESSLSQSEFSDTWKWKTEDDDNSGFDEDNGGGATESGSRGGVEGGEGSRAIMRVKMAAEIQKTTVNEGLTLPAQKFKPFSIKGNQIAKKKANIDLVIAKPLIEKGDRENKDYVAQDLKGQVEKQQSENQRLRSEIEYLKEAVDKSDTSDIGNNIFVKKAALHALKSVSGNVNVFARNLFKHVFEIHEIVGRSLMGKKCNARKDFEVNPAVNEAKRDAVIQYALTEFKMGAGTGAYKSALNAVKHSLSNLVVELNQEAKRAEKAITEKLAELEIENANLKNLLTSMGEIDIGNGIMLKREYICTIKATSKTANIFGRSLFRKLFRDDEVIGYSLMGRGCNANQSETLPSIDPRRRDALIGYTLTTFGEKIGTKTFESAKKELKKSLSSLIIEMSKNAKSVEASRGSP